MPWFKGFWRKRESEEQKPPEPPAYITLDEIKREQSKLLSLVMDMGDYLNETMDTDKAYPDKEMCKIIRSALSEKIKLYYGNRELKEWELSYTSGAITSYMEMLGVLENHTTLSPGGHYSLREQPREEMLARLESFKRIYFKK